MQEASAKSAAYAAVVQRLEALLAGEHDSIARMATIVCELHHGLPHFDWSGFYRVTAPGILKVGPYQGGHGCLVIPFERGVCGACARERRTQLVADVNAVPAHIACSSSTQSEIVVPVFARDGALLAVLDIDSDSPAAFDATDQQWLEKIAAMVDPANP